jgi:hypothetical protein
MVNISNSDAYRPKLLPDYIWRSKICEKLANGAERWTRNINGTPTGNRGVDLCSNRDVAKHLRGNSGSVKGNGVELSTGDVRLYVRYIW